MKEYPTGIWLDPEKELPEVFEDESGFETSRAVVIRGKDRCIWLAFWNGENWINANSSDMIWMEKDYVVAWMCIPKYTGEYER